MPNANSADQLKVFWQPGCSSCLRVKEYLDAHRVPYVSRNVLADPEAFAELRQFGLRQVPIVMRGGKFVDGQMLAEVASLAGLIAERSKMLSPTELADRLFATLATAASALQQFPETRLGENFLDRPRTVADLIFHIFNVADAFIELTEGKPLTFESYNRTPAPDPVLLKLRAGLVAYADSVRARALVCFSDQADMFDWQQQANVYYGAQSLHQFLERTTWHCLQHTRQLMALLTDSRVSPDMPLDSALLDSLPLPLNVWDPA